MPGYVLNALETTYGTPPASGYRDSGLNADGFKSKQDILQRAVLRPRTGAPTLAGRRIIDKGGEGVIDIDAGSNGLGLYLRCAASTSASALVEDGTLAHEQVFEWTTGVPVAENTSLTTEVYRDQVDGDVDVWQYRGGKATQLEIGQSLDGFLNLKFTMDYLSASRLVSNPGRTPVVPDVDFLYAWPDALITLTPKAGGGGNTECLSSFTLTLPDGMDTEAWCLKRGTAKHEPTRSQTPAPSGTLEWKYQHPRYYDAFKAGTPFTVSANWQAPTAIEATTYPSLTIDIGTIVFEEANDPTLAVDGPTTQSLPFVVLDDESGDPVVTWTQVTSDTAL